MNVRVWKLITTKRARMYVSDDCYVTGAIERAEAEDVAAARAALARIDAGDEPVSLADSRAELGL